MAGEEEGEGGIGYWVRWQVPICGLIIIFPSFLAYYTINNVKERDPLHLHSLWKPQWSCLHPAWLLLYRAVAFVCLSPMLYDIVAMDGAFAFYFYTQWTFTLVMVYFAVGTVVSAYGCWLTSKKSVSVNDVEDQEDASSLVYSENRIRGTIKLQRHYKEEAIQQHAGFWGYLMQTIYQISAGAVILTDIVFWCILVPFESNAHLGMNLLIGCMHSLNAVFLLLDTALNSLPFPWFRLAYFVQWSCIYIVFQWILHACGFSWWPYPFLDLNTPWAPLWYFALAVVHIPCYGIYALIVEAKNSILPRWFPHAFVRSY